MKIISPREQALINLCNATDAGGYPVILCHAPLRVEDLRGSLAGMAKWFVPQLKFFSVEAEIAACGNIILLAEALKATLEEAARAAAH